MIYDEPRDEARGSGEEEGGGWIGRKMGESGERERGGEWWRWGGRKGKGGEEEEG